MKNQVKFWIGWAYQIVFGLLLGFLIGFIIAIKPKEGGGILRNSDTLPFVLGVGLVFVMVVTQFCSRMDKKQEDSQGHAKPELTEEIKQVRIGKILSMMVGIIGFGLIVMSFLRTFKIMPRW